MKCFFFVWKHNLMEKLLFRMYNCVKSYFSSTISGFFSERWLCWEEPFTRRDCNWIDFGEGVATGLGLPPWLEPAWVEPFFLAIFADFAHPAICCCAWSVNIAPLNELPILSPKEDQTRIRIVWWFWVYVSIQFVSEHKNMYLSNEGV